MTKDETRRRAERIAAKVAAAYVGCVKLTPWPTGCVISFYGCECEVGQYCDRLPPPNGRVYRRRKTSS